MRASQIFSIVLSLYHEANNRLQNAFKAERSLSSDQNSVIFVDVMKMKGEAEIEQIMK